MHQRALEEAMETDKTGTAYIEVTAPIPEEIEETHEINCYALPGGEMTKIINKGPYEKCEPAYNKVFDWIRKNGKKIDSPTRARAG